MHLYCCTETGKILHDIEGRRLSAETVMDVLMKGKPLPRETESQWWEHLLIASGLLPSGSHASQAQLKEFNIPWLLTGAMSDASEDMLMQATKSFV